MNQEDKILSIKKEVKMATLGEIERLTREYADARRVLSERVQSLESEISALKRMYLPRIRKALEDAAEKRSRLYAAIEESPELFKKPRTIIFHGVKIGYQKSKGEIKWEDTEQVVKLIKKHFPDSYETYIKITETPIKSALAQLSVQELKKLGITVVETGDEIIIKTTDTEIDKLVDSLLKDEKKELIEAL